VCVDMKRLGGFPALFFEGRLFDVPVYILLNRLFLVLCLVSIVPSLFEVPFSRDVDCQR
jgi:hypothetical protein